MRLFKKIMFFSNICVMQNYNGMQKDVLDQMNTEYINCFLLFSTS